MVALDFDASVLDRSAGAKPGFQLGGKFGEAPLIQRKIGDDRHAFSAPTLRFSSHPNHGGFTFTWLVRLAGASLLELVALGAEQFSPVIISHYAAPIAGNNLGQRLLANKRRRICNP
jgi:hypothetical protein